MLLDKEMDISKSRYYLMKHVVSQLKPVSIISQEKDKKENVSMKNILEKYKQGNTSYSPIRITTKEFLPLSPKQTIFNACNDILKKESEGRFEYNTDGGHIPEKDAMGREKFWEDLGRPDA
jgi:hypothetical protein